MMLTLGERILQCLAAFPQIRHYWLAFSGGLDSQVLLHCLASQRERLVGTELTAVHINHQLQPMAQQWVEQCQQQTKRWQIKCLSITVDAHPQHGASPEAAAREARYSALKGLLSTDAAILTAHHQTDQAETLLLQLLRGAGPAGVAAMPVCKKFGSGWLLRPMLNCQRHELLDYAKAHNLRWIEDASNKDERFDRNYLRHQVLPVLRQRWPGVEKTLARSAQLAAEANGLLHELAEQDLNKLCEVGENSLCLAQLTTLSPQRQHNVLRYWLHGLGFALPSFAQLQQLTEQMLSARQDAQPLIIWPGCEVRRYRGRLYALSAAPFDRSQVLDWAGVSALKLPDAGYLYWVEDSRGGLCKSYLHDLTVRYRQGGERYQPQGRKHSQSLKKLLQDLAIPPWERDRLPLLYSGNQLAWVPGLGPAEQVCVPTGQSGMRLRWQKKNDSVSV